MNCGFVKGAVAGAIAGATVALVLDPITPRQRRRTIRKAEYMVSDMKRAVKDMMPH